MFYSGFIAPGGIRIHGSGFLLLKGHHQIGQCSVIPDRLIKQIRNIIKRIVIIKVGGIFLVFFPVIASEQSVIIHRYQNCFQLLIPFKGSFQIF